MLNLLFLEGKFIFATTFLPYNTHNIDHQQLTNTFHVSVDIPNSVTSIGKSAFSECSSLTSIDIPNSITSIGEYAFNNCPALTSITIPNSLTSIGECAFRSCRALTSVYYNSESPIEGNSNIFDNCPEDATLYVPEAAIEKCKAIDPWKRFTNIKSNIFSGIEDAIADFDQNAPIEVYDIKGVKVADNADNLPAGLFIVRQGKTVRKVTVK